MVHLHLHSKFSLRDSIIKPEELAVKLNELGQTAVAITDHGSSLGGISIYKTLKKSNIKMILGVEAYICDDVKEKNKDSKYYHLVLLCKNDSARKNLNKLISISEHPDNKYSKPRIDFNILKQYSEGLIILSACLAGEIGKYIQNGDINKARETAKKYKEHFGENYYLEIQSRNDDEQIKVNKIIRDIANELKIECVVTTDAHYVNKDDSKYQSKYAFYGAYKETDEAYKDCYIQSEVEVRDNLKYFDNLFVDKIINNTDLISNMCNVEMPLSAPIMPEISVPKEYDDSLHWLREISIEGFKQKLNVNLDTKDIYDNSREFKLSKQQIREYIDRYEYEVDNLHKMGFIDYILLVYSYANKGTRRGIARGSCGGSLVCFVTNITAIDPIEHGLYFERFIDVGALELLKDGIITKNELKIPDADLDFSGDSRDMVLKFLYDTYGERNVASIGKFGNNFTKGTIRDMCKVLNIGLQDADLIAKSFESYEIEDIDVFIAENVDVSTTAKDAVKYVKQYPELFEYVRKLNGLPKSFGLHASAKVVSTTILDDYLPSSYDKDGIRYLQGDMHDVEDVGLVKIDLLGLRTLDQEYDTLEMSGEDIEFINPKQEYNDSKVFDIFNKGNTTGIFQFASNGMKQTLKKMNVQSIDHLSIANALFRPGAMPYIDTFCARRNGEEIVEYTHPSLEPILKNTYGVTVFQEQLIEIGRMAGMRNPDELRIATGKKKPEVLAKVKPELESKLKEKGWTEEQFNRQWVDMLEFSKYSFNKAHSSAYAILAYMTAKQKAYYPSEFFAGLMNSYIGHSSFIKDNVDEIVQNMCENNVMFDTFNFRNDHRRCNVQNKQIKYAIPLIRDCNTKIAEELFQLNKNKYNNFLDLLYDLSKTTINKKQLEILVLLDYFSPEFGNSNELMEIIRWFNYFKKGSAKTLDKSKVSAIIRDIVEKYSVSTDKQYKLNDVYNCLREIEDIIKSNNLRDYTFRMKALTHIDNLGYVAIKTQQEEDIHKLFILDVEPLKTKDKSKIWGYRLKSHSIARGKRSELTIWAKTFDKNPIQKFDTLYVNPAWVQVKDTGEFRNVWLNNWHVLPE